MLGGRQEGGKAGRQVQTRQGSGIDGFWKGWRTRGGPNEHEERHGDKTEEGEKGMEGRLTTGKTSEKKEKGKGRRGQKRGEEGKKDTGNGGERKRE